MIDEILNTAHIHLDHAIFRVHVKKSDVFPIDKMNEAEDKPDFVLYVGKSNDKEQNKHSILVNVVDGYDLNKLADWLKTYEVEVNGC